MIRLQFTGQDMDAVQQKGDIEIDRGYTSSIFLSLSIDRNQDRTPAWWGAVIDPDLIGARRPIKNTPEERELGRLYIQEALAWLVRDGHAESVTASIARTEDQRVEYLVVIKKGTQETMYEIYWDYTQYTIREI